MITSIYHTLRFWILITLLSLVLAPAAIFARLLDSSNKLSHRISSAWSRYLCAGNGVDVQIIGLEHVAVDQAQVFVANHQSYFDIFTLAGYLPIQLRWVAKQSLFRIPLVGWAMAAAGYIPVDRSNRKKSYQAFIASVEQLKAGNSIVIFPEGTRSADGVIGPFKKGGHLLAVRSKVAMVPVTLIGTGSIIKKGSGVIQPGPVKIIISPPVSAEQLAAGKEEQILESIRDTVVRTYEAESGQK